MLRDILLLMKQDKQKSKTTPYTKQDLEHHLAEEHHQSPFSEYLKEIVYGGNDGIVTTFAIVAGFSGAQGGAIAASIPAIAVILFGFANLFADGASMALGNFLSIRADQDVYKQHRTKENHEIHTNPQMEWHETVEVMKQKGFSETDAKQLADIYQKNESYWTEFMMRDELEMSDPLKDNPLYSAVATFFSFTLFGFVPLVPYIFLKDSMNIFFLSIAFTGIALFLLGLLRYQVTRINIVRSVGEVIALGSAAATIAYFVGTFFRM